MTLKCQHKACSESPFLLLHKAIWNILENSCHGEHKTTKMSLAKQHFKRGERLRAGEIAQLVTCFFGSPAHPYRAVCEQDDCCHRNTREVGTGGSLGLAG